MEKLIEISPTTNYNFSIDEIAFMFNAKKSLIKAKIDQTFSRTPELLTVQVVNKALTKLTLSSNPERFSQALAQAHLRLISHIDSIKVVRSVQKTGIKYPQLSTGACSLIKAFCDEKQKERVLNIMLNSKWDSSWTRFSRAPWGNKISESIGLLQLV